MIYLSDSWVKNGLNFESHVAQMWPSQSQASSHDIFCIVAGYIGQLGKGSEKKPYFLWSFAKPPPRPPPPPGMVFLQIKKLPLFLDTHVSLAPTHVCLSVRKSYFRISILSVSLVALREKLKREDPNYFQMRKHL